MKIKNGKVTEWQCQVFKERVGKLMHALPEDECELPLVFICSPFTGDKEICSRLAEKVCFYAMKNRFIPLSPHLFFPNFLKETPEMKGIIIYAEVVMMEKCAEVWVVGDFLTVRMAGQIQWAHSHGIRVRYFTDEMQEIREDEQSFSENCDM